MALFNPRASNDPEKRRHPDLDEDGYLRADTYWYPDVAEREFNRSMQDPAQSAHFMQQVAQAQALEHPDVQAAVGGNTYGSSPAEGYRNYRAALGVQREWVARMEGKEVFVDDADVARMSLDEYDSLFDSNGRPKPHVYYYRNRSVWLNDGIDGHSARELGSNR